MHADTRDMHAHTCIYACTSTCVCRLLHAYFMKSNRQRRRPQGRKAGSTMLHSEPSPPPLPPALFDTFLFCCFAIRMGPKSQRRKNYTPTTFGKNHTYVHTCLRTYLCTYMHEYTRTYIRTTYLLSCCSGQVSEWWSAFGAAGGTRVR